MKQIAFTILGGFIAACGGIVVAFWNDRLTRDRERIAGIRTRRRAFLAFMESWKYEIGRFYLVVGGFENKEEAFAGVISTFLHEADLIRRDFEGTKRVEFEGLCTAVVGQKHRSIYGPEMAKAAQDDINKLIAFVDTNGV